MPWNENVTEEDKELLRAWGRLLLLPFRLVGFILGSIAGITMFVGILLLVGLAGGAIVFAVHLIIGAVTGTIL